VYAGAAGPVGTVPMRARRGTVLNKGRRICDICPLLCLDRANKATAGRGKDDNRSTGGPCSRIVSPAPGDGDSGKQSPWDAGFPASLHILCHMAVGALQAETRPLEKARPEPRRDSLRR
jgi:hypothetical protein